MSLSNPSPYKAFYSVKETAAALSISRVTLYRLVNERKLRANKIGRRTVFARTEIERFAAALMQAAA